MKKVIISIFITAILGFCGVRAQDLSLDILKSVEPSKTRFVTSLGSVGSWKMSKDGESWTTVKLPAGDESAAQVYFKMNPSKISSEDFDKYTTWRLYFLGVDDQVEVTVNGKELGKFFGGMTPFYVRIPKELMQKRTLSLELTVYPASKGVDRAKSASVFASKIYAGLLRDVMLVGSRDVWVENAKCDVELSSDFSSAVCSVGAKISSGELNETVSYSVRDDSTGETVIRKVDRVKARVSIIDKITGQTIAASESSFLEITRENTINIDLTVNASGFRIWDIEYEEANLYDLSVEAMDDAGNTIDEISINLAFMDLRVGDAGKGKSIFLNGRTIEIKGVDYVEKRYFGDLNQYYKTAESDIKELKTLGVNLVKFKHSPPHPYILKLCEENGLLASVDLPAREIPNALLNSKEITTRMTNVAQRYLNYYDKFSCVAAWGVSEGLDESSATANQFNSRIAKILRKESEKLIYKEVFPGVENPVYSDFDFIIVGEYYPGYSLSDYEEKVMKTINKYEKVPVVLNYGMLVQQGNQKGASHPLSVFRQAENVKAVYGFSENLNLAGLVIWTFKDYELDNPLMPPDNDNRYLCTSGLIDYYGNRRPAFDALKALLKKEDRIETYEAGNYSPATSAVYIAGGLALMIVLALLINRFKRFREYLFRSLQRPYNFYADIRDQRIMSNAQTYFLGVILALTSGIYISSFLYSMRMSVPAQYVYSLLLPSDTLKVAMYEMVSSPALSTLAVTLLISILIITLTVALRVIAAFVRARVYFSDAITMAIWSGAPILILLPFSIFLVKLLDISEIAAIVFAALFVFVAFWTFFRFLKATAVVFDFSLFKAYLFGSLAVIVVFILAAGFYQYQFSTFAYVEYLINSILAI